ncbi:sacsin N-terminal ATP-binding-like domain-containing protein [Cellulomonas fengjieae]|uniref:sacsin N-terminal ATP-binding-like domain-containing protein n=1 Tax=Cellulomonas fengjieae TaxID=2819978 RepID=UPI001AAFD785|nr:ATP-binding protein [Cellulomonas fengjieae]MBO3100702.1 ATP-binding protein [Cellulomonas fengjieae]
MTADAFGTAALRAAVLGAWRASPARLREDANTEEDHARGYYRDRVLVELAQNAADAATRAGVPGRLLLRLAHADDGTIALVAANTGAPLDADGVASLSSMRASAKRGGGRVVGRFGVGFAAVRAVSDEVSLLSTTGGVRFSLRDTAELLSEAAADVPALAEEVRRRDGSLPALRLPLPADGRPPTGYDTAVVLQLRDEVAADEVRSLLREIGDPLLLALPGLVEILVEDHTSDDAPRRLADVEERWVVESAEGELSVGVVADRPVEERAARTWRVTWAIPRDPGASWPRVVHAPTPTDEPCTVPALLVATLPLDPTRRHVAAGRLADVVLGHAADAYARLGHARAVAVADPLALVPTGLAAGALDGALRDLVVERLARTPLLRRAAPPDDGDPLVAPDRAVMLSGAAGTHPGAVAALGRWIAGLALVPVGREAQARTLGVEVRSLADVVEELPAVDDADWSHLYDALEPLADDASAREALGALPVPLADGRVVRGARGLVVLDPSDAAAVGTDALRVLGRWGLRVVDPAAAHPLLARLGADAPDARGLLAHPALRGAVLDQADDDDLALADEVTDAVLAVVRAAVGGARAGAGHQPWLGLLTLPAADGEPTPAHGLVLPGGPAADLLDPRVLAPVTLATVERWGADTLVAVGVRDDLALVRVAGVVAEPAALDPDGTDDASLAAQSLDSWSDYVAHLAATLGPGEYVGDLDAVADLDAVDPQRWPGVLARLATVPELRRALVEPVRGERGSTAESYTAWWLRERGPELGGIFAVDGDGALGGLVEPALRDVLPAAPALVRGLDAGVQRALGGVASFAELGAEAWVQVLDSLGPAGSPVDARTAVALWRGIAAVAARSDASAARPAARVPALVAPARAAVVHADDAAVAEQPMWWQRTDVAAMVPAPDVLADAVATLLELPLATELADGRVDEGGAVPHPVPAEVASLVPDAPTTWWEHDELTVDDAPVDWWVTGVGAQAVVRAVHAAGLAAGLAQAAGRWPARHAIESVLVAPDRAAELVLGTVLDEPAADAPPAPPR